MSKRFLAKKYQGMTDVEEGLKDKIKGFDDAIDLSIGDPDVSVPDFILKLAYEDTLKGHTKYTDVRGYEELRSEISKFYDKKYGMKVNDNEIMVTTAANVAMYLTLRAVINEGDEVIVIEPFFFPYSTQIDMAGGVCVYFQTEMENEFNIDFEKLEKTVTEKTKAIIINTPNNPTGICYTKEMYEKFKTIAEKHDLLIIADDIYTSFSFKEPFMPIASLEGMFERVITINSFSKNLLVTGLRVGNIVAPKEIIRAIASINSSVVYAPPSFSQRAALHGLIHFEKIEKDIQEVFKERLDYIYKRIDKIPFMDVVKAYGSFYVFPSIKKTGLNGVEFSKILLDQAHILVIPGIAFGKSGEYNFRISCTVGIDTLKEAFDRIEKLKF